MTEYKRVRTYPNEKKVDGIDTANQVNWDLKGTWGWRAVGLISDGKVVEWIAHHPEINEVVEWWPNFEDEPVWRKHSIYAFSNGIKYHDEMALFVWPDELDKKAELRL